MSTIQFFPRIPGRWKFEQPNFKEEMLKGWPEDVEVSNWSVNKSDRTTYWSFSFSKYLTLHKNSTKYIALYRTEMGKNCFKYFSIAIRTLWIKVDS